MFALYIILAIITLIILWLIFVYNGLITLKNRTQEALSDIDVQLKRRHDLIPNLIETVKGYVKHEKGVLTEVTKMRTEAINAKTMGERAGKENQITEALKTIFAVAENYPQLKASENFKELQGELTDTEDKISASRRFYNGNVRDFNIKMQVFPNNFIASQLKFKPFELFEAASSEKESVKVEF